MTPDENIYATALAVACKRALFDVDQILSGRAEGSQYRVSADQYTDARACIERLYAVINAPQLLPVSEPARPVLHLVSTGTVSVVSTTRPVLRLVR